MQCAPTARPLHVMPISCIALARAQTMQAEGAVQSPACVGQSMGHTSRRHALRSAWQWTVGVKCGSRLALASDCLDIV